MMNRVERGLLRGISKDLRALVVKCEKQGGHVEIAGSGHLQWTAPDGFEFSSSCTTGSHREPHRVASILRKHGMR